MHNPLNTRIFAGDFQFGEFRAILRGVVVKKIHNSSGSVDNVFFGEGTEIVIFLKGQKLL